MNILRTNYELPVGKDFITPYWFLGFVEGVKKKKENIFSFFLYYAALYTEGSFFVLQRKNQPSSLSVVCLVYIKQLEI